MVSQKITTYDQFIEKLAKIVSESDRMLLVINDLVEVQAPFFNYADIQRLIYLLFRTPCEWWIKPNGDGSVKLRIRLFI